MIDRERNIAQEEYIVQFADDKGMTVERLENRLLNDLAAGVPDEKTMNMLIGMFAACERVTAADADPLNADPFAPDYDALAQVEPTSQYQDSRDSAGLG